MKLSVVIPAFNAEATIEKCLASLLRQSLPPFEIIVVDDNSTDETSSIAEKFAKVLKNSGRKGVGGARNTGAYAARGEILVFSDSDCVFPENWLEKIAGPFEDDKIGGVAGGYKNHEGNSFIGHFAFLELSDRRRNTPEFVETAVSNNLAVRRGLFLKVKGFPETLPTLEDMVFTFKLSRVARIKWLRNNSIGHHFRETIGGYLSQQFAFARDTTVVYRELPKLFGVKTHHGRLLYFETMIAGMTLLSISRPQRFFGGIALLALLNGSLFWEILCNRGWVDTVKALFFIPIRDLNMVCGVFAGILKVLFSGQPFLADQVPIIAGLTENPE